MINDKIIRVSGTIEKSFSDPQSLIIVDQKVTTPFDVTNDEKSVKISTKNITANILRSTGEILFEDKSGQKLLQEQIGGGKIFKEYNCEQIHADGKPEKYKGWTTQQIFESPDDEAFFG